MKNNKLTAVKQNLTVKNILLTKINNEYKRLFITSSYAVCLSIMAMKGL